MLYLIYQGNHPDLAYSGGQGPIVHMEADLRQTIEWADARGLRWALTLGNAGSYYFEDRNDLNHLGEIDWNAVGARDWRGYKEGKQAEFLIEREFPWDLVSRIGVRSRATYDQVLTVLHGLTHKPIVEMKPEWYY
jgi:hypothetical protein